MKFSKKKGDALSPNSGYSLPVYQSAPSGSPGAPPKKEKNGLWWFATVFFFFSAFAYMPSFASVLCFFAGMFTMPIKKFKNFWSKIGLKGSYKALCTVVMLFAIALTVPSKPAAPANAAVSPEDTAIIQESGSEEAAKLETEQKVAEEAAKLEAEQKAAEEAAKLEAEQKAAEEAAKLEAEQKAAEEAAKLEAEQKAAEEAAKLEAEQKAAEEAAKLEAEQKAAEEAAKLEAEQKADSALPSRESSASQTSKEEPQASGQGSQKEGSTNVVTEAPYAASAKSKVFHYSWCEHVGTIKKSNLRFFETREKAAFNRRPCKDCNP